MLIAQDIKDIFGKVQPPEALKPLVAEKSGAAGISLFLNNSITLIYTVAAVVFVFMILWGAFEWISSGGNKESVDSARKRIVNALIGLTILAVAFAIITLAGSFLNIDLFNLTVPTPDKPTPF